MFVEALPAGIAEAASGLAGIGAAVAAGNAAGAAPTLGVVPPAPEPASVLLAAAFGTHAGVYQATQAVGSVMHAMFVSTMGASSADLRRDRGAQHDRDGLVPGFAARSHGRLRGSPGDQLRPDVCRPGFGVSDGFGVGLAGAVRTAGLGGCSVSVGHRGVDLHGVDGSVLDDDGVGRGALCGVDDRHR